MIEQTIPQRYSNFIKWHSRNGCKIDPRVAIEADVSGSMGFSTKADLPAKTVVMAVPGKLILTV